MYSDLLTLRAHPHLRVHAKSVFISSELLFVAGSLTTGRNAGLIGLLCNKILFTIFRDTILNIGQTYFY